MAKQTTKPSSLAARKKKAAAGKKKPVAKRPVRKARKPQAAPMAKKPKAKAPKSAVAKADLRAKPDYFQSRLASDHNEKGALIPLLQAAQEAYGYIPEKAIGEIHEAVGIPVAEIYGVITFYSQFRLKPLGKYLIKLCDGTACHVNSSERIAVAIEDELQLGGNDTTADSLFTLQKVACLGCCSLSPVIMINDETYGRLTPKKVQQLLKEYKAKSQKPQTA